MCLLIDLEFSIVDKRFVLVLVKTRGFLGFVSKNLKFSSELSSGLEG